MQEVFKKPYEISVWEDVLVSEGESSYYKEKKIAVIGSDKMDMPNRAYGGVLTKNVNGETSLTFSLAYKYFDAGAGQVVTNPFANYLINERKVKLFYDGKWYDFVIKECEEDSESMVFTYTARDLFVQELSKVGYNVTLDQELGNNQGTAVELAKVVLEDTDWEVEENSDVLQQYVREPLYKVKVTHTGGVEVLNLDTNGEVTIAENEIIYVFYTYVANKDGTNLQFLRATDSFTEDSNGALHGTNYRITDFIPEIVDNGITNVGVIQGLYTEHQGYRLVYKQSTTYDPVMKRTVNRYQATFGNKDAQEVYKYTDYEYTTSDIVTSYVTNGSNFNIYEDGSLQGWRECLTESDESSEVIRELVPLDLTTYPEISITTNVTKITNFAKINGFLETKLGADEYVFNSGFEDNSDTLKRIVKGEDYVLRVRGGSSNDKHGNLVKFATDECVRAIVAKYENYIPEGGYYYNGALITSVPIKRPLLDSVILDFNGEFAVKNNIISSGTFDNDMKNYRVNSVVQEPSARYVYVDTEDSGGAQYVWDSDNQIYILKENANFFMDYLYTRATAQQAISTDEFKTGEANVGIFLYVDGESGLRGDWLYINDIQITRYYEDEDGQPVLIGNVPVAHSISTDYYYLKPATNASADEINQYHSIVDLQEELGATAIEPIYNENCEKILTVSESRSNCFNILQSICETFECWLELRVPHDEQGYIKTKNDGAPIKRVVFREYAGKDNWAGFKYGINVDSIQRNVISDEFVTKLIVENTASEYTKSGALSIQDAPSNPSLESYILDFSYYQKKGLINNIEESNANLYNFYERLHAANQAYKEAQERVVDIEASLVKIKSQRNVYSELIDKAADEELKARKKFAELTNMDYDVYVEQQEADSKIEDQNVADTIAKLYACSSTINNYSGLLTNLNKEYNNLNLECYGERDYSLVITTVVGDTSATKVVLNDYFDGVQFTVFTNDSSEQDVTSPNARIFNYSTAYDNIRIDSLPNNYKIIYYEGNHERTIGAGAIFDIKGTGGKTTRLKLVPSGERQKSASEIADDLLEAKKQIEKEFYTIYSRFIQEGTWSSTNYIDPELYYLDALQVSHVSAQPKVSYTIKVLEVSEIEGLQNYTFDVGDKTRIEDVEFFGYSLDGQMRDPLWREQPILTPAREEVVVSEVEWHLDEPDENTITVQNYKDQFEDLFQRLTATVQSVQYNEPAYARMASLMDANGTINQNTLIDSLDNLAGQRFNLTGDGSVYVQNGIWMRSLTGGNRMVKVDSEGIAISDDGGINWVYVINSTGINTDKLIAGEVDTQQIDILDGANPSFRWDKKGISAYSLDTDGDEGEDGPYNLKTFVRFDKYGLYGIQNNESFVANDLEEIQDNANFGVTWDGFFIKNKYRDAYVSITSDDDFQIVGNGTAVFVIDGITKTATF